jgi:hypothetical protein
MANLSNEWMSLHDFHDVLSEPEYKQRQPPREAAVKLAILAVDIVCGC